MNDDQRIIAQRRDLAHLSEVPESLYALRNYEAKARLGTAVMSVEGARAMHQRLLREQVDDIAAMTHQHPGAKSGAR